MGNLLQKGSEWLGNRSKDTLASPVVFTRGADSVSIMAMIGRSSYVQVRQDGSATRVDSRDFLFLSVDLVLDSVETLPAEGDTITETDTAAGKTYTYEVLRPAGEPCWRYSDAFRQVLRVHTKFKSQASI